MFEQNDNNLKSTLELMYDKRNDNIIDNKDRRDENGNIDNNYNYKKRNVDVNDETKQGSYNTNDSQYENEKKLPKSHLFTNQVNKDKILDITNDINKNIKGFQIIPLHIQKGKEKKFLLVKTNMTLKEILFINFQDSNCENITFYNGNDKIILDKTIEDQNITPLSLIRDYPE